MFNEKRCRQLVHHSQQDKSAILDNDTENNLQISFRARFLKAKAIEKAIGTESTSFHWSVLPQAVPNTENIRADATKLAKDAILFIRVSEFVRLSMKIDPRANESLEEVFEAPSKEHNSGWSESIEKAPKEPAAPTTPITDTREDEDDLSLASCPL